MSDDGSTSYESLFSSLRSDIKSYNGIDPLLPWLRGIRRMKEMLPPQLLKQKLPRFLQKCSENFMTDRRYLNDLRYIRVWLQLMDFLDDPKAALLTMEKNGIGVKKSLFYQAYALYYEKKKKFEAAEKIYYRGVQNLAEPADDLQKSYEQFLHRMGRHKKKSVQLRGGKPNDRLLNRDNIDMHHNYVQEGSRNIGLLNDQFSKNVVVSDSEHASHYDLVEPTINTKDATKAINDMFGETMEPPIHQHEHQHQQSLSFTSKFESQSNQSTADDATNGFTIFTDESVDTHRRPPEPFKIFIDGEDSIEFEEKENAESIKTEKPVDAHTVYAKPNDQETSKDASDAKTRIAHQAGFREDTIVYRFVGSTISDEPLVENAWHHGLVDPTVNLKEAMKDINSMFGKPIEFARKSRMKKSEKEPANQQTGFLILPDDEPVHNLAEDNDVGKPVNEHSGFLILPDDELDDEAENNLPSSTAKKEGDLFEQTVCTKEAMAEINKLFAMSLDF